jgi:DNA polymerase-3 subunit alpha
MKAKMALTDVGRILGIDIKIVKAITGLFGLQHENEILSVVQTNPKIKQYYDSYPELFNIADKLLGMPRQSGIHAAGLVICNEDLTNIIPVLHIEDKVVLQYEMNYVEPLGLIKMDLLGLSNLSTIKKIIELIKSTKNYDINLNEIELNNENVFRQLSTGDTIGIFQLESNGMTNLIRQLKPKNIEDISLVLALYRPGPMQNIKTFLENKSNPSKIVYLNDTFKKYLSNTFNVIVYQEQMMEIIKSMCNYSFAKADIFRRIMSKKKHDELKKLEIEFLQDAVKNGYSENDSKNVFGYIESFADYGFNHSHSLSYAYIAY